MISVARERRISRRATWHVHLARGRRILCRILLHVYLIVISSFGLFPFIWLLSTSFKTQREIYTVRPSLLPQEFSLINYEYVLTGVHGMRRAGVSQLLVLYRNSLVVSVTSVLLTVIIASLAAYAVARLRFRGRDALFSFFIVLMFLPAGGTLMAQWELMRHLNLLDSLPGLILLYTGGGGVPLFLMRQVFLSIPTELEDAARIDGASNLRIAFQIMFPLATSGMVMVAIMHFLFCWGEFLVARTMIMTAERMTLPPGIFTVIFITPAVSVVSTYGVIATSVTLMVLPAILIFVFLQRWFIRGAVEGLKL
jgi:ABC-type glycerol-3-phosphate transport system permease component